MSIALMMSGLGALAISSAIALAAQDAPGPIGDHPQGDMTRAQVEAKALEHFARMDADKDGRLTKADRAAAHQRMAGMMFDRMDADKNGQISRDEFTAAGERMAAHRGPGRRLAGHMLSRADADKNGELSQQEFQARALSHFDRADADKNGVVTEAERRQAREAMRERFGG